ncbi:hypothetical protein ABZ202_05150 [Streptomyces sp. NPDC006186]|uniref:Uncharacterized protein n=1 Tax=Streptomyces thermocoprophilus TaxID=78356 RepID=A0ABV5VLA4_9ACTN
MRIDRLRLGVLGLALLCALTTAPAAASAVAASPPPPSAEEQRLDGVVPQEILRMSGFDDAAPEFARDGLGIIAQVREILRVAAAGA